MQITIHVTGVKEVVQRFDALRSTHLPITMAATLSRLASQAQANIREEVLPQHFILRKAAWARSGIRITPATKTRWIAEVRDINPYMELQETGGEKLPFGKYIAVPLSGARPTPQSNISDANRPKAIMENGGFIRNGVIYKVKFIHRGASAMPGLKGSGRDRPARAEVIPMYKLVERAELKPRYGFVDAIERIVNANFQTEFQKAFAQFTR